MRRVRPEPPKGGSHPCDDGTWAGGLPFYSDDQPKWITNSRCYVERVLPLRMSGVIMTTHPAYRPRPVDPKNNLSPAMDGTCSMHHKPGSDILGLSHMSAKYQDFARIHACYRGTICPLVAACPHHASQRVASRSVSPRFYVCTTDGEASMPHLRCASRVIGLVVVVGIILGGRAAATLRCQWTWEGCRCVFIGCC